MRKANNINVSEERFTVAQNGAGRTLISHGRLPGLRGINQRLRIPLDTARQLDTWARRFVRRIRPAGCADDLADDALQYLQMLILQDCHIAAVNGRFLIAWGKRVIQNFVISEIRRSKRHRNSFVEQNPQQRDLEIATDTRRSVNGLLRLLRNELEQGGTPRGRKHRLASFERWLREYFSDSPHTEAPSKEQRHRVEQQNFRDRSTVRRAFQNLRSRDRIPTDYLDIAVALGLASNT